MSSLKDKIPNNALVGEEVLEIAVKEFRSMLERDCLLNSRNIAYRRVAMTLTSTFHFGDPHPPAHTIKSRVQPDGVVEGEAPLSPVPDEGAVTALERDVELQNPNLDRVHHDMPIRLQRALPPQPIVQDSPLPGEPPSVLLHPATVENLELRYDKTDYPAPPPPVDRDVTVAAAAQMGVKARTAGGLGLRKRP